MHILRLYTATVLSFISIGSSVEEKLCLQEIRTDGQGDSSFNIPHTKTLIAGRVGEGGVLLV